MIKYMPVTNEEEGREWCFINGFDYCGTRIHKDYGYVMAYDDGHIEISEKEENYLYAQYLKDEKERQREEKKKAVLNETWVIASDDGINSRMYLSKSKSKKDCYTFEITEAKKCTKLEAQKTAALMTQRSRTGRVWFGLRIS